MRNWRIVSVWCTIYSNDVLFSVNTCVLCCVHSLQVQPNNADASQTDTATADQQQPDDDAVATRKRLSHPQDIFRVNCRCTDCLQYRETAIQLLIEDVEYAILWKQLLKLLYGYYDMVPPK